MDVIAEPLLDFCNHVADTVQLGLQSTDLEMEAIFHTFLNDNVLDTRTKNATKANISSPVSRNLKKRLTGARALSKKKIDDAPLLASSQSSISTVLQAKNWNNMCHPDRHYCTLRRRITNDTYLRRLYMAPADVVTLFPFLASKLQAITKMRSQRCRRLQTQLPGLNHDFVMTDAIGRRWTVTCNCKISGSGILHCKLTGGWSCFCRENNVTIHDNVVLVQGYGLSADVHVYVDRRNVSIVT